MRSEVYRDLVKCSVKIELGNGKLLLGVIEKPRSKSLAEYLNNGESFFDLQLYDGPVIQVAKVAVLTCEQRETTKPEHLSTAIKAADVENPLAILGLEAAESKEQIRQAYLRRMRLYHSDRYGGVELPREVVEHMASMTKRINAAYRDALAMAEQGSKPRH
jgi:hypothetical protein